MKEYSNSQMEHVIDEYVHSKRDRKLLKMCFIDGVTHEQISCDEEIDLTPRQVSRLISKYSIIIDQHLNEIT